MHYITLITREKDLIQGWRPLVLEEFPNRNKGPVVRKPITANPGLDVVQGFLFCLKVLGLLILGDNFKAAKVKLLRERKQLEPLSLGIKSKLNVGANPGLALSCFEQPGPGDEDHFASNHCVIFGGL